ETPRHSRNSCSRHSAESPIAACRQRPARPQHSHCLAQEGSSLMLLPSPVKPQVKKNTLYAERQPAERKQKPVAIVVLVQSEAGQRSRAWETRRAGHAPRGDERHAEARRVLQFPSLDAPRTRAVLGW